MREQPTVPVQPDEEPDRPTRPDPRPVADALDDFLRELAVTAALTEAL